MADPLTELADLADELCDPRQHVERVHDRVDRGTRRMRAHVTTQAGLLAQLAEAAVEGAAAEETSGGRSVPQSRPPGCWEAIARHTAITLHVAHWCWDLRLEQRATVEANLRALVGAAPRVDSDTVRALVADARRWRHQAAVMTGWASPSFAPQAPCPQCARPGSIRINLARKSAMCTNEARDAQGRLLCGAMWDQDTIGLLGEYISQQTEPDQNGQRVKVRSGRAGHGAWLADTPDRPNG